MLPGAPVSEAKIGIDIGGTTIGMTGGSFSSIFFRNSMMSSSWESLRANRA